MSGPDLHDPDEPMYASLDEWLAALRDARYFQLERAIDTLQRVGPRREMKAAIEVLTEAIANLDMWTEAMAQMIERDRLASLGQVQRH